MKEIGIGLLMMVFGFNAGISWNGQDYKEMHCAPIVKASTMEEAIKQIEINQAISGVKG